MSCRVAVLCLAAAVAAIRQTAAYPTYGPNFLGVDIPYSIAQAAYDGIGGITAAVGDLMSLGGLSGLGGFAGPGRLGDLGGIIGSDGSGPLEGLLGSHTLDVSKGLNLGTLSGGSDGSHGPGLFGGFIKSHKSDASDGSHGSGGLLNLGSFLGSRGSHESSGTLLSHESHDEESHESDDDGSNESDG